MKPKILANTILCLAIVIPDLVLAEPWTPAEWQESGKLHGWVRDSNRNFVDDLIEEKTGSVDVIVDLNQCAGDPAASKLIAFLNTFGDVIYVGKYVSFVVVTGVDPGRAADIAAHSAVAMVEMATVDPWLGDNYRAAKVQSSSTYANTLDDDFGWPATLHGNGVGIAFLDSGAGPAFDAFVTHGYDALSDTETNPAPTPSFDHATWMAGWVFGTGRIAPQASLIDMKVGDASGASSAAVLRALEKVYERRTAWDIHVVTMMFSGSAPLDGREARQQLLDFLTGHGIVVAASTGSNATGVAVTGPGAATRAIGVSTADIKGTVDRSDDDATYVQGPRQDDGDTDPLDELKPEVIMPTGEGSTAVSNSIAAAQTAGLAALILQQSSDLRDSANKASGSLKDLLIRSAEVKGSADTTVAYPRSAATWDQFWGFGEIDANAAFRHLTGQETAGRTDLTFLGFDGSSHPSSPWYYSRSVETQSERNATNITSGTADTIFARVFNTQSENANRVRVSFGFYPFTAGVPVFYDIGSVVTDITGSSDKVVSINWTPPTMPAGEDHGCILVTIDYGYDSDFSGGSNFAQKNVRVTGTSSPAVFKFRVENPLPTLAKINLVATKVEDWTLKLSETTFNLAPHDCAPTVIATAEPTGRLETGAEALFFVTAYATTRDQEKGVEIGGVALRARYEGKARVPDIPWILILAVLLAVLIFYTVVRRRKP